MLNKLAQGIIITITIVILPTVGNPAILRASHLWILVTIGILASVFQPQYNPFEKVQGTADRGTASQIIWSVYVTQILIILEATYLRYPQSISWTPCTSIALVLMITGLLIRTWAVFTLDQYFTWHVSVQETQTIIQHGPYAYIRHPGYAGALLTFTGTAVFLHAWTTLPLCVVCLIFAFARRIQCEEKELHTKLGAGYDTYCSHVPRFIPGVW